MKRLELEGPLEMEEIEGGFAPSAISVAGTYLDQRIAELLGIRINCRGSPECDGLVGHCKLILEIEPEK